MHESVHTCIWGGDGGLLTPGSGMGCPGAQTVCPCSVLPSTAREAGLSRQGHDLGQQTLPTQLKIKLPPRWGGWPIFCFPNGRDKRVSGLRHIHAHTHCEGEEQYNLKTACKSVKQISIAWISQIIEPQSITNIKCIWPSGGQAQLKNANGNLLGTWKL